MEYGIFIWDSKLTAELNSDNTVFRKNIKTGGQKLNKGEATCSGFSPLQVAFYFTYSINMSI